MNQANGNPLLPYNLERLPNGMTLIHKEIRTAPIAAMDIWIHTGAIHDPEPHYGLSHFFEHMFFKGTERFGVGEMDRIITMLGGYNNAATSLDYTHYYVVLPSVGWRAALDTMMDSLLRPLFDPAEIERERSVIIEEIKRHEDNPWSKIYDEFTRTAFSKCPYSRQILGTEESLRTIGRDAFLDYHRSRYTPANTSIVMTGDFSLDECREALLEFSAGAETGNGTAGGANEAPFEMIEAPAETALCRDVKQSYLLIGFPTPRLTGTPGEYAMDALSSILGDGRSSRLYRRLNDELGIVSSIGCGYWSLKHAGLFVIEAVTEPSKLGQVEDEINRELDRLADSMREDELEKVKSMTRADFAFSNEKVISMAQTYGYGHVVSSIEQAVHYVQSFDQLTLGDLRGAFGGHIAPDRRCKGILLPNESS